MYLTVYYNYLYTAVITILPLLLLALSNVGILLRLFANSKIRKRRRCAHSMRTTWPIIDRLQLARLPRQPGDGERRLHAAQRRLHRPAHGRSGIGT